MIDVNEDYETQIKGTEILESTLLLNSTTFIGNKATIRHTENCVKEGKFRFT